MPRWPRSRPLLAAALLVAACGSEPRPTTPVAPLTAAAPDAGPPIESTRPEITLRPPRGAPHYNAIVSTAVSRGGTAALSRDVLNEVRVWPSLDGTIAPRAVPVKGVVSMRVQDSGSEIVAGFAEASGGGHLVRFDRSGTRLGVAEVTGPGTVLQVTPLGDASGAIVLFADHSLALVGLDGTTRSTLARRGMRLRALEAVGAAGAVVMVRKVDDVGEVSHAVARLDTAGGTLVYGAEITLPAEPLEPTRFAVSPDGSRLAYTRDPDEAVARPAPKRKADAKGAPAAPRRPSPPRPVPAPARVTVVDTATGRDVTPDELRQQPFTEVSGLGFTATDRLHVFDQSNQSDVDLTAGVLVSGSLIRSGAPAVAADLMVTGYDVALVTQVPGGPTRYLGWQSNQPQRVALSPDGRRAAWGTARGELLIESLDGSQEVYGGLFDAPVQFLSFLGDDHVVLGSGRGTVHLVDVRTGKEQGALLPPGPLHAATADARGGWLAGLRPGGGVWLVKITPGAAMPSTTLSVADGAQQFTLLAGADAGEPVLLTEDAKHAVRRYTAAELAAGVSAKSIRERTAVALPRAMTRYDRGGRGYAIDGRKLLVYEGAKATRIMELAFDPIDLTISDDGKVLVVLDRHNGMARIGDDGKVMWTASMGPAGRWAWILSPDGGRLAAVGQAGGLVVDTSTGEQIMTSCAWRFGLTAAPPLAHAVGQLPICQ